MLDHTAQRAGNAEQGEEGAVERTSFHTEWKVLRKYLAVAGSALTGRQPDQLP